MIGIIASLVLVIIGMFLLLRGYNRRQDLQFVAGVWLYLSALCLLIGFSSPPFSWPRFVLLLTLVGIGMLAVGFLGGRRSRMFLIAGALWAWFWLAAIRGYARGGWPGVLLISLPAYVLPAIVLYIVSGYLLPLRDQSQRRQAFRALLTSLLGTNHPYYIIDSDEWGRDKVKQQHQMGGSAFIPLLGGPGVVISRCDHAPVISDGVNFKGVKEPGVSFTGYADSVPQTIDLREQLRAFPVEARTKDGIGVSIFTFTPFRIDPGEEVPELGKPFPFRASAVFKALHQAQVVEHKGKGQIPERMEALLWDDLPPLIARRILRDVIAKYRFDDLSAPFQLADDPRIKVANEFKERLRQELAPCGIRLEGGGISNIFPVEGSQREIFEQRIQSWRVHWVRHIMKQQFQGERSRLRQIEKARAKAQADAILEISNRLAQLSATQPTASPEEVFKVIIDMIQTMAVNPLVQRLLSENFFESFGRLEGVSKKTS